METREKIGHGPGDPLGLVALGAAVEALRKERAAEFEGGRETAGALVGRLLGAYSDFSVKMDLLRDRYALLKKTSAQLAEEVTWLRDQLDDLRAADGESAPSAERHPTGDNRRYGDRFSDRGTDV